MMVCKANHGIPVGEYAGREYYRIWPMEVELGKYPYVVRNLTPLLCMQCETPPCVVVCQIPGAIYRREDGIVLIDEKKCNGCNHIFDYAMCFLHSLFASLRQILGGFSDIFKA